LCKYLSYNEEAVPRNNSSCYLLLCTYSFSLFLGLGCFHFRWNPSRNNIYILLFGLGCFSLQVKSLPKKFTSFFSVLDVFTSGEIAPKKIVYIILFGPGCFHFRWNPSRKNCLHNFSIFTTISQLAYKTFSRNG